MAFPTPLYVLLKGGAYLTIKDAVAETREDIINWDQSNYRDINSVVAASSGIQEQISLLTTPIVASGGGATAQATFTAVGSPATNEYVKVEGTSSIVQDDTYTHKAPRREAHSRTMIRWWSSLGSSNFTISGTTAIGSCQITIPSGSIKGIYPGAGLSGTGVPNGAVVQDVVPVVSDAGVLTYAIISSLAATGAATVELTIASQGQVSGLVGECWADRFIGWSSEPPKR